MPDSFTNVTPQRQVVVPTTSRFGGYASGGYQNVMPLTAKEREARRQARMASRPGTFNRTAGAGPNFNQRGAAIDFAMGSGMGMNTTVSTTSNFFSPQLSPDFLELPQSLREKREIYRHFYNSDPLVGQAIDLHTELPLSKVRLGAPKPRTCPEGFDSPDDYGKYIYNFFERMCKRVKLFSRLITAVHHYWLDGNAFIFAEDSEVQLPPEIGYEQKAIKRNVLSDDGEPMEEESTEWVEKTNRQEEELKYYRKQYKGWDRLIIMPLDQVKVTTYSFTDKVRIELIPSDRDRGLIEQARMGGDPIAEQMAAEIPSEVREHIERGRLIPLGIDPEEGSFVYHLAGRRGATDELGQSILDRCLRDLYYKEKLRQAQTQIASRAMTPKRIVWGDRISEQDTDELREQVDLALVDPDYSIVANYEVHWDEMGSKDRLLDLSGEYEITDKHLITGLGVTESLMSGESLYSGDRLKLEVINSRYMFLRDVLQEYVEEYLFKPVARRKGFVETDKWGEEVVLYPKLTFTRLPLRDSQDTFDALNNLYLKGSVPIDVILEMFNIDPVDTKKKLEEDLFTVNDSTFNEIVRGIGTGVAGKIADESDIMDRLIKYLRLKMKKKPEGEAGGEDNRF